VTDLSDERYMENRGALALGRDLLAERDALEEALREVSNAYGCFAGGTGGLPGAPANTHTPACWAAREALGKRGES
jgi:hypothetical protein